MHSALVFCIKESCFETKTSDPSVQIPRGSPAEKRKAPNTKKGEMKWNINHFQLLIGIAQIAQNIAQNLKISQAHPHAYCSDC